MIAKCQICGREFATEAALAQHLKDKHSQESSPGVREKGAPSSEPVSRAKPKSLRKRNRHPVAIGLVIVVIVLGVGFYEVVAPSFVSPPFPCATGANNIHVHPYLRILIDGQNVVIPGEVGFFNGGTCLEPIHTHDASGILHVELNAADKNQNFTLGDFFRIWSATPGMNTVSFNGTTHPVSFSSTNILGYMTDSTHRVVVRVDNQTVANPSLIPLEQLDYCSAANTSVPPCAPTAGGNPLWKGTSNYPYGTGHTIVIEYVKT